ncbi:MAG: hypothetical protein JOZ41_06530 [Chloroflexi bacterium]|nr:hypothetical protein [Chloroflexota bacterium]
MGCACRATSTGCGLTYHAGVAVDGANPSITHSTFDHIAGNDVEVAHGGLPTLHYDDFLAVPAGYDGVANDGWMSPSPKVDATTSWWGSASGPYDPAGNPNGQGTPVGAGVIYSPWEGGAPGPSSVPSAPTRVAASPTFGGLLVSWMPPSSDGGQPITSYIVTVYSGTSSAVARQVALAAPCTPAYGRLTCSGAVFRVGKGTYTVTVRAVNAAGAGPESSRSAPVTL